MVTHLFRIICKDFVAGVVLNNKGVVIECAPIFKWLKNKEFKQQIEYIVNRYDAKIEYIGKFDEED